MSNSQSTHLNIDAESCHHGENNNIVPSNKVPPADPNGAPVANPVDANSHVANDVNLPTNPEKSVHGGARPTTQGTPEGKGERINMQVFFEML